MTESININSLANHHIWSTIKTLPATLPEPRSGVRGPSFEAQGPSFTDNGPAVSDRGPRTGVTGAVCQSDLHLWEGWGWINGVGSCGPDLGSGIGGGGGG